MFNVWKTINAYAEYANNVHHVVRVERILMNTKNLSEKSRYDRNNVTAVQLSMPATIRYDNYGPNSTLITWPKNFSSVISY
jgi:hypothetical protein